jgi:hypothetical protein
LYLKLYSLTFLQQIYKLFMSSDHGNTFNETTLYNHYKSIPMTIFVGFFLLLNLLLQKFLKVFSCCSIILDTNLVSNFHAGHNVSFIQPNDMQST